VGSSSLASCTLYGLHRPGRVLADGDVEISLTVDVARFVSHAAEAERAPDVLSGLLFVPVLTVRRGLGVGIDADLEVFPVGLRLGVRRQFLGDAVSPVAAAAEGGLTLAVLVDVSSREGRNARLLLIPDGAVAASVSPVPGADLYGALRYAWLREKIAGSGFGHTPALALGGRFLAKKLVLGAEASAFWSPSSGDLILVPGAGAGLRLAR
jgi:hypothetical protein